ncbi:MAG: YjbQ family protein [Smithella sp.]
MVGASELVIIENGCLILGIRQSIFFCEFEGFRTRKVIIKFINTKQIKILSFK